MSNKATLIAVAAGAVALVALRIYDKKAFNSLICGAVDVVVAVGETSKQNSQEEFFIKRYEAYVQEIKTLDEQDRAIFFVNKKSSHAHACLVTFYHNRDEESERALVSAIASYRREVRFWG